MKLNVQVVAFVSALVWGGLAMLMTGLANLSLITQKGGLRQ